MYEIIFTKLFRKSYRKILYSGKEKDLHQEIFLVTNIIANSGRLPERYKDHSLSGKYQNHRECHLKPNLLLIYRLDKIENALFVTNIGSHSELFS